ncbi:cytochrome P450 76C4-like [Quercus suber]|uniref:cytochrome P450 76C4-like n=1 Tax=Quercus suber TaxID=58331 RepID=UPI0032DEEBD3
MEMPTRHFRRTFLDEVFIRNAKSFNLADFADADLPSVIHSRGWESLCVVPITCPLVLIQEFYSNMHGIDRSVPLFFTRVRGTRIPITLQLVADVLRVPRIEFPDYPSCERLRTVSKDELISAFYQRLQLRASSKGSNKKNNDVLDSLLSLTEEDNSEMSLIDIKHLLLDLFIAGIDTTSSTTEWAMTLLLHNPEKMTKARDELEEVLGTGGHVQESDISKFHYLQAIVKETLRLHPPLPFLIPRKSETNIEICGFLVPKNAQILINVWAMGRDSSIWKNPNLFMPERFLEQDIDFKGQYFELIPFGAGKRICPGLPLANKMVHLMLASLIHYFAWKLPDEMRPEDMDMGEFFGLTLHRAKSLQAIPIKSF